MPKPQAPPAPIPARDAKLDARQGAASRARRSAAGSNAESTVLGGAALGDSQSGPAPIATPILGG